MNSLNKFWNINKINLNKLILGSFLISLSIILTQLNKFFNMPFNKSLYTENHYLCYWYYPFFIMGFLFNFSYNLFFLFIYFILDIFFYSGIQYLNQLPFLTEFSQYSFNSSNKTFLFFNMILFGSMIPILTYSITSFFLFNQKKNNYKKTVLFFLILVFIQSFSRFLCGFFCYWGPNTKYHNLIFKNVNYFFKTKNRILFYYFFMFFWNFFPIIVSNLILIILFFFSKISILNFYKYFYFNKKIQENKY
jgi:hypothetical protein